VCTVKTSNGAAHKALSNKNREHCLANQVADYVNNI